MISRTLRRCGPRRSPLKLAGCALLLCSAVAPLGAAQSPASQPKKFPPATSKPELVSSRLNPAFNKPALSAADLAAIEKQVRKIVDRLMEVTVAVQVGDTQGSGVVVTPDGYVLTAAHVAGAPGRKVTVIFNDTRRAEAMSLGLNATSDVGLIKITTPDKYPFAPMSDLEQLSAGTWCIATGHPGGYETGRPPVLRLGRVGRIATGREAMIQTDCTLVGGDSGGPLFDLEGNVIAIHSRIGAPTTLNLHVPIRAITDHWERFANSERMGGKEPQQRVLLGVNGEDHPQGARVTAVFSGMPAVQAGMATGDIVTHIDGVTIKNFEEMRKLIAKKSAGDTIKIRVVRNDQPLEMSALLMSYP